MFVGEIDYIHKGLGAIILRKFLEVIVFGQRNTPSCIIGPEPSNIVAIRAYAKAGFKYWKTIHAPDEDEPEYLMRIARDAIEG